MHHDLALVATDHTPEARNALLHSVTDLYLAAHAPSERAQADYAAIAKTALAALGSGERAGFAQRVASEATLPRPLALTIAKDAAEVAYLVLKLSPVLTDEDLTALAATQSQGHLIAIAEREALAEITSEVLASRGDPLVLRTLSANPGARLSEKGLACLVDRGGTDPAVRANLAKRAMHRPERQAQRVLRLAIQVEEADAPPTRQALRRQVEVNGLIADVLKGRRVLDEVILRLVQQDQAFELAAFMSHFAKGSTPQVLKALLTPEPAGFVALCRGLKVSPAVFRALSTLRSRRLGLTRQQVRAELMLFTEAPTRAADRAA